MIKFFRKIRYDLMEKNKTGKYLKYAIGEIVLVVIGILLALQVNNWNINRINTNSYNNVLTSLIADLENDINELDNLVSISKKQNIIIIKTLNNKETTIDNIRAYIKQLCFSPESFTPNTTSFKILENYGSSNLLKIKEISTDVQSLYNSAYKINQESYNDRNTLISSRIRPLIMKSKLITLDLNGEIMLDENEVKHILSINGELTGPLKELFVLNAILIRERLEPLKEKFKDIASKLKQLKTK